MKNYLDIMQNIISHGEWKETRTGIRCKTTFCETFRHDMAAGFPLLTTKKMGLKNISVELQGFMHGITSKKWYQDRKCRIWDEWANPIEVEKALEHAKWDCAEMGGPPSPHETEQNIKKQLKLQVQKECDDLGPVYGYQWRNFGAQYGKLNGHTSGYEWNSTPNGMEHGFDQFQFIVDTLKTNPLDRRMVCSAWNPNQSDMMALPPCHLLWNVVVIGNKLNLCWFQRSNDFFLGNPYNIASYGMLLLLLAKESGLQPGILHGTFSDCHIYENHIAQVEEQLSREPFRLPNVEITGDQSIFDWTYENFNLENYMSHDSIKAKVAV